MTGVSLDYRPPAEALRDHISLFYEFRADVPVFEDDERADLAQLRFLIAGGPGEYRFADGHVAPAPMIAIVGPTTGPTHVRVEGPVHLVGAGLLPDGWARLLPFEASTLVNRVVDATVVIGPELARTARALQQAKGFDARVNILAALVEKLVAGHVAPAAGFTRTVDDWLVSSPSPDVEALVVACGLSRRQVERQCKRFYGSPPKVLARKYRALKAAIALARGDAETADLLEDGFYDQSHFIREIKHFTGVTPKRIADDLPTLARLTLRRTEFVGMSPLVTGT